MFALGNVEFNAVYEIFFPLWEIMQFSACWFKRNEGWKVILIASERNYVGDFAKNFPQNQYYVGRFRAKTPTKL